MRNTIIHIIPSLGRGGAEVVLVGIVKALKAYQHVIFCLQKRNDFQEELNGVEILYFDFKGYASLPGVARKIRIAMKPYRDTGIVHANTLWANVLSRMAVPKRMPLINSYHSVSYGREGANYPIHAQLLDRFSYQKRVFTLCVSRAVQQNIARYLGIRQRVMVLYNYVEEQFYQDHPRPYLPGTPVQLVSVGTLKTAKNYPLTLAALGILQQRGKSHICNLDILGNGPLEQLLKLKAKELGLSNVRFLGHVGAVEEKLQNYDAFLLSSQNEGFGIALAQALASGLPAIASDLPSLHEVTGGHALFFDPASPEQLAGILEEVYSGELELDAMAAKSKAHAEQFRKSFYIDQLREIYARMS